MIKTILVSSLIVMAFMTVVRSNQAVMASDDIRPGNVLSRMEKCVYTIVCMQIIYD